MLKQIALPIAFALVFAFAVVEPTYAQSASGGAEAAATNFTTLMTNVARIAAAGFFFGGLIVIAVGSLFGMPKFAMTGKAGAGFGVVLFLAQRVYAFLTDTAGSILG